MQSPPAFCPSRRTDSISSSFAIRTQEGQNFYLQKIKTSIKKRSFRPPGHSGWSHNGFDYDLNGTIGGNSTRADLIVVTLGHQISLILKIQNRGWFCARKGGFLLLPLDTEAKQTPPTQNFSSVSARLPQIQIE